MNIAVILAGGIGRRFGSPIPKQFVNVLGKPIIAYTVEHFENHPCIDAILVVCVRSYIDYMWELKNTYKFSKLKWIVEGGDSFQNSVMNGVDYLYDKIDANDIVLVHFGASPFVTQEIITDALKVCKDNGTNAISSTDFYLLSGKKKYLISTSDKKNYTDEYIDRNSIAIMNTPHAFRYKFIVDLYDEAKQTGVINTVEPHTTTLMYALGKPIYFSKGSQSNIKITNAEDIELFEGYALARQIRNRNQKVEDALNKLNIID